MPEASAPLSLLISGTAFDGWKKVLVRRSLEALAGEFSLEVSEPFPHDIPARRVQIGSACEVHAEDDVALEGYVEAVAPSHSSTHHGLTISGRDRTGDLVDCSAIHSPGEWSGLRIDRIARILCEPFGVTVRAEVDVGKAFERFRLQESETAFHALERMARHRGLMIVSNGRAEVVLTRRSAVRATTSLELGVNIRAGSAPYSDVDRYSTYTVKGQRHGTDTLWGSQISSSAQAVDPHVERYRPLSMIAEAQADAGDLRDRAQWEASRRAARARRPTLTVRGWRDAGGELWQPNRIVRVRDDWLEIDAELLIVTAALRYDAAGTVTELALARPEAFDLVAFPEAEPAELWLETPSND